MDCRCYRTHTEGAKMNHQKLIEDKLELEADKRNLQHIIQLMKKEITRVESREKRLISHIQQLHRSISQSKQDSCESCLFTGELCKHIHCEIRE